MLIPVLPPFYSWRGLQIHSSYSSPVIRSLPVVSNITEAQVELLPVASSGGTCLPVTWTSDRAPGLQISCDYLGSTFARTLDLKKAWSVHGFFHR